MTISSSIYNIANNSDFNSSSKTRTAAERQRQQLNDRCSIVEKRMLAYNDESYYHTSKFAGTVLLVIVVAIVRLAWLVESVEPCHLASAAAQSEVQQPTASPANSNYTEIMLAYWIAHAGVSFRGLWHVDVFLV
jgi:hypothetical protein